jgi:hypothetical protein
LVGWVAMKMRTRAFGEDCEPRRFQGRGSPAGTRSKRKLCAAYRNGAQCLPAPALSISHLYPTPSLPIIRNYPCFPSLFSLELQVQAW